VIMLRRIRAPTSAGERTALMAVLVACVVTGVAPLQAATFSQTVHIDTGTVSGMPRSNSGVTAFEGIPFAAPPIGELRWKPPVPPAKLSGVLNADRFGPSCMQVIRHESAGGKAFSSDSRVPNETSEDCLFLNVWTPAKSAADRLPVMVWIYGGGFQVGSGAVPIYNGEGLASKGVVVVSMNYRLGIFGFLALPELDKESLHGVSGNYGTLDQIAALQWVDRNIAAFGGDHKRVTIFGQSAGGGSVQFLTLSPLAKGLFQRAISENGTLFQYDPYLQERSPIAYKTRDNAEPDNWGYLRGAGVESQQQLRAMSAAQLSALPPAPFPPAFFSPIVDGWVLPQGFAETYARGTQIDVPFMAGWTSSYYPQLKITVAEYRKWAGQRFGAMAAEFLALYPVSTDEEAAQAIEESARDSYRASIYLWAQIRQKNGPFKTYLYYFNHALPGPDKARLGATAGSEIPYVLDSLARSGRTFVKEDYALADMMTSYWVNFAANGDPNGKGLPVWPAFHSGAIVMMQLGDNSGQIPVATKARVEFYQRYFATQPKCAFAQGCSIGTP
jgi:para-nitrobenzyl esterase